MHMQEQGIDVSLGCGLDTAACKQPHGELKLVLRAAFASSAMCMSGGLGLTIGINFRKIDDIASPHARATRTAAVHEVDLERAGIALADLCDLEEHGDACSRHACHCA